LGAEWERVERCLYVNLLRRRRRALLGESGEEAKGWEEDIEVFVTVSLSK
jgi:hypothetical protein